MKPNLLKNMYATIAALFVVMFALPTTMHAQTEYDLTICGTKVTSANCNDLSKIDGVSGTAKYDPSSKVLTLQNATISCDNNNAIVSYIDDLTIKVIGTSTITAIGNAALSFRNPLFILGGGVLNAKSISDCAIYANGTNLTIENCTVNAESEAYGIAGGNGENEKLTIRNAKVTAIGTGYGSICDFAELNMVDSYIIEPSGATFSSSKHGIVLNGEIVKSKVVIANQITNYDLTICGVEVTSGNCSNLSVIDGVSGTVKYDPSNKLLTLQGATISSNTTNAIVSNIDDLTIKVIGTNNLTTVGNAALSFRNPLFILGGGVLNAKSISDCAIYANGTNLTIENCTVNAESGAYAIAGKSGSSEKFTIRNATVTAIGTGNGSICDFAELNLKGCYITEPSGAKFSSSMHGIVLNGAIVKSKVVIKKDPTAIETPTADNTAVEGIYTFSGVRMSGELKDLPKGVYVVNGKKVVKQ
ncbi:peptidase [uncultured Prevotella sp.]|uniref:peptidase n=1 Tax=uncultured Prevotella sp. TaxID=159272 RepID=UPI0027D9B007|nr:peptidase [uncultured Prevotella sp.]